MSSINLTIRPAMPTADLESQDPELLQFEMLAENDGLKRAKINFGSSPRRWSELVFFNPSGVLDLADLFPTLDSASNLPGTAKVIVEAQPTSRVVIATATAVGTDGCYVRVRASEGGTILVEGIVAEDFPGGGDAIGYAEAVRNYLNDNIALTPLVESYEYVAASTSFTGTLTPGSAGNAYVFETNDPSLLPVPCDIEVDGVRYSYRGQDSGKPWYFKVGEPTSDGIWSVQWSNGDSAWNRFNGNGDLVDSSPTDTPVPYSPINTDWVTTDPTAVAGSFVAEYKEDGTPCDVRVTGIGAGDYTYRGLDIVGGGTSYYNLAGQPSDTGVYAVSDAQSNGYWSVYGAGGSPISNASDLPDTPYFALWTGSTVTPIQGGADATLKSSTVADLLNGVRIITDADAVLTQYDNNKLIVFNFTDSQHSVTWSGDIPTGLNIRWLQTGANSAVFPTGSVFSFWNGLNYTNGSGSQGTIVSPDGTTIYVGGQMTD